MDYLTGSIKDTKTGLVLSEISGNYMGYINFDSSRYFDIRAMEICEVSSLSLSCSLLSDSRHRIDSV